MAVFEGIDYSNEFHEVGESFIKDGAIYVTLVSKASDAACEGCAFNKECKHLCSAPELNCVASERKDRKSVIYKKVNSDEVEAGTPA